MGINIDIDSIIQLSQNNPFVMMWIIFLRGGWIIFLFFFVWALGQIWLAYIQGQYRKHRKYVLLAIDVPKENEQTPLGVENIFQHLAGIHATFDFLDKWWDGSTQESFSLEIISLEGYIQFLIRTEVHYRDLIEAAFYAQYPDAEIVEVEDYLNDWNITFPHPEYDQWSTEIKLAKKHFYPIKTHPAFEDSISQEHKDPMSGLMEALGKIGPGEQVWFQMVITAADNDWGEKAQPLIQKLIGGKVVEKQTGLDLLFNIPATVINVIMDFWNATPATDQKNSEQENRWLNMTQGEKDIVTDIEKKCGKTGFHVRMRYIYVAKHEVFDKTKASKVIYGALKQFNRLDANAFKPHTKYWTGAIHFMAKRRLIWRRNKNMRFFRDRGHTIAADDYGFILNTEELASVWHFPNMATKAPLIKKTESKKAEPPLALPLETEERMLRQVSQVKKAVEVDTSDTVNIAEQHENDQPITADKQKAQAPDNLPTV
ncbi:hypothetical protein KKA15_05745 [Patescibacteria group bacterium]|nr:hypothetical protein [Patescibacteria group bacterium]